MNELSRRHVLAGAGALVVSFTLVPRFAVAQAQDKQADDAQNVGVEPKKAPKLPGSLENEPMLDSWIRIGADGSITVFTGKVELGQGIKTALIQVAAEELSVEPGAIALVTADTHETPNEGYTAGSNSMTNSATAIAHAAAQARDILVLLAAARLNAEPDQLTVADGTVGAADGQRIAFGDLVTDQTLHVRARDGSRLKEPARHSIVGTNYPRVDIPAKIGGAPAYVQDLRLDGMVHGRIVPPPSYGARLEEVDTSAVERLPGFLKLVRDGSFIGVICEGEFQAVQAMQALGRAAKWRSETSLPDPDGIYEMLRTLPAQDSVIRDETGGAGAPARALEATFRRPYQMHAAIGPSCAVALMQDDMLTVWTHSQGVYPLRKAIAEMMRIGEDKIRCIHLEGSGCYGHNGADDAGADAALLARALPGRPVRVQWMREHEHAWEPYGPAMIARVQAGLDAQGTIVDWRYEVWSNAHSTRPGPAGQLIAARHLAEPFAAPAPRPLPQPEGGGDRNAIPLYRLPTARVVSHFIPEMPLRVSALRALGAYLNVFAIESFMDQLAVAAQSDPVAFRLRHLDDERARDVITTAAQRFGWSNSPAGTGRGQGFGFARYKNLAAYCAVAMDVEVERDTGRVRIRRAVAAVDSGTAVNPDGIRNQIEGAIVQSLSWTLFEAVAFDQRRIVSTDWSRYPVVRFRALPESVEVQVIDRPGEPYLGTGEAGQGPAAAALANAIAHATGMRFHDLPMSPERLRAALAV
jgi:CO/xanthine dehydrogenase Mo-binding subunit